MPPGPPAPRRRPADPVLVVAALFIALLVVAPWLLSADPLAQDLSARNAPPAAAAWFGRDNLGRDVFARVVYGAHVSLEVAAAVVLISLGVGTLIGALVLVFVRKTKKER